MLKFKKHTTSSPQLSTASLPDIVFILLFFFMVATHIRQKNAPAQLPIVSFPTVVANADNAWKLALHPEHPDYYFLNDHALTHNDLESHFTKKGNSIPSLQVYLDKNVEMKEITQLKTLLHKFKIQKIEYMVYN
ncbi:MAG: biopolymer transporter ExbD [Saprospiraceae bacterium]|nr:biopolymer transporter ExbD [Saprospiraceae bacterium]